MFFLRRAHCRLRRAGTTNEAGRGPGARAGSGVSAVTDGAPAACGLRHGDRRAARAGRGGIWPTSDQWGVLERRGPSRGNGGGRAWAGQPPGGGEGIRKTAGACRGGKRRTSQAEPCFLPEHGGAFGEYDVGPCQPIGPFGDSFGGLQPFRARGARPSVCSVAMPADLRSCCCRRHLPVRPPFSRTYADRAEPPAAPPKMSFSRRARAAGLFFAAGAALGGTKGRRFALRYGGRPAQGQRARSRAPFRLPRRASRAGPWPGPAGGPSFAAGRRAGGRCVAGGPSGRLGAAGGPPPAGIWSRAGRPARLRCAGGRLAESGRGGAGRQREGCCQSHERLTGSARGWSRRRGINPDDGRRAPVDEGKGGRHSQVFGRNVEGRVRGRSARSCWETRPGVRGRWECRQHLAPGVQGSLTADEGTRRSAGFR